MIKNATYLLTLFVLLACSPFGADDNKGGVVFSPPFRPMPVYNMTYYNADFDVSTYPTSISISPVATAETIVSCTSDTLPTGLTLSSNCTISGNLSSPQYATTYNVHGLSALGTTYHGLASIAAHTDACASNSATNSSNTYGTGTSSNPYIICTTDQFEKFMVNSNGTGIAKIQNDLNFGTTIVGTIGTLQNASLDGYGHKITFDINPSGVNSPVYENIGFFTDIINSSVSRIVFHGSIKSPTAAAIVSATISNSTVENILIEQGSSVEAVDGSGFSIATTFGSVNTISNSILNLNFTSTNYDPIIQRIDSSDLLPSEINIFNNNKFFSASSSGSIQTISPFPSHYNVISTTDYFDSGNNMSLYTNYDTDYWEFIAAQAPKLKKEKIHVYE